ncbi:MAG: orotidine-5'-phosphate decarboxylase [Symbiobacteriaceae bacterium]|nr:orotidine-5'-phosphate decarboxylase [Symbiobacteriaceae bacterium]
MPELKPEERLIVALDVANHETAAQLVEQLTPAVSYFKIGLELFYAANRQTAQLVVASGAKLFLDLKLHDIPNTVSRAIVQLVEIGASMVNFHISGGRAMLEAAREAAERRAAQLGVPPPLLLGVTVLTSLAAEDLAAEGIALAPHLVVEKRTRLAWEAGLDGIVCSPQEAALVKEVSGGRLFTVTPGIRQADNADDHSRYTTPAVAIKGGSDYLVVGRPIYEAADPLAAALAIQQQIKEVMLV